MFGLTNRDLLESTVLDEFERLITKLKGFLLEEHNEDGTHRVAAATAGLVPVGAVMPYAGATAPSGGWLICDGSQVSRVTYKSLFEVIGTGYGVGDGSLTFNLPDLRQRFPLGKAASGTGATLGETGGAIDHTHTSGSHTHSISSDGSHSHTGNTGSSGSHTHSFSDTSSGASGSSGTGAGFPSGGTVPDMSHTHDVSGTTDDPGGHAHSISADGSHSHGGVTGSSSGTTGDENPPFVVFNYLIQTGVL